MKPSYKIFIAFLLLLLAVILTQSCNPVKRTLNKIKTNQEVFNAVEKYMIKDLKLCINDTTIITKDSIQYIPKDSLIRDTVNTPCPDFSTKTSNSATITSKNGVMTLEFPIKTVTIKTLRTVTNNIRDKKLESILTTELDQKSALYKKSQEDLKISQSELKAANRKVTYIYIGIGFVLLIVIGLKTGLIKKFIPFL